MPNFKQLIQNNRGCYSIYCILLGYCKLLLYIILHYSLNLYQFKKSYIVEIDKLLGEQSIEQ